MPRTAERTRIVQYLEAKTIWGIFFGDLGDGADVGSESEADEGFENGVDEESENEEGFIDGQTPEQLLELVYTSRYLEPRLSVPKSRDWSINVLPNYNDTRFRQTLRVSRNTFDLILDSIKAYPSFHNNSSNKQLPVELQLQIALFRFGRSGNAASLKDISRTFGVSEGTILNSTR